MDAGKATAGRCEVTMLVLFDVDKNLLSCLAAARAATVAAAVALLAGLAAGARTQAPVELVESFPVETSLDHADIPDAHVVWREMIDGAATSLCFAEFYASNEGGSRLEPIVRAIEVAAARGVRVRFLAERKFHETYPVTLDRLGACEGIEVRLFDLKALSGGVLHAKYFLVDGREAYLGSQNFDWRSLAHIQELGVRIREPFLAAGLADVFALDWALAGGLNLEDARAAIERPGGDLPARLDRFFADGWNGPYATPVDPGATYRTPRIGE